MLYILYLKSVKTQTNVDSKTQGIYTIFITRMVLHDMYYMMLISIMYPFKKSFVFIHVWYIELNSIVIKQTIDRLYIKPYYVEQ